MSMACRGAAFLTLDFGHECAEQPHGLHRLLQVPLVGHLDSNEAPATLVVSEKEREREAES